MIVRLQTRLLLDFLLWGALATATAVLNYPITSIMVGAIGIIYMFREVSNYKTVVDSFHRSDS